MSHIDDLIAEQCPAGVAHHPLHELIADLRTGLNPRQNFKLNTADARNLYMTVRELGGFELRPSDKTDRVNDSGLALIQNRSRLKPGDVLLSATGTIGRTALVAEPARDWNIKEGVYAITPCTELILSKFLIYLLHSKPVRNTILSQADGSTVASISMATLRKVRVPVPPLEVQRDIVRILDQFTQLEAELETELETRRQQYEHYSEALLESDETVAEARLGDVSTIVRGASPRPIRSFVTTSDDGVPWIKIGDVPAAGKYITGTAQRVTPAGAAKSRRVRPGDFVLSNSMSFGRPYISKIDGYIHDGWLAITDFETSFLPDYLYYLLRSSVVQAEFARRAGAGTVKNLNADIVKSVTVPVPTRAEQERVVGLLDRFDALVNDLSIGLPAELVARRKQYEYYRDRLLTFQEAPA